MPEPLSIRLHLYRTSFTGAAGKAFDLQCTDVLIPAMKTTPAEGEPCGERQACRWKRKRETQMSMFEGGSANQRAEEASQVSDANGHGAYSFKLRGLDITLRSDLDRERAKACAA